MQGLHEQRFLARFDVDIADRPERDPAAGIEVLDKIVFLLLAAQLFLHHPKYFRADLFELIFGCVTDTLGRVDDLRVLAVQAIAEKLAALRQQLFRRTSHFG